MLRELLNLIEKMNDPKINELNIIYWGSPIISFGNLKYAKVATVGLNPSNMEFVDSKGNELIGGERRFHTLESLGLSDWSGVEEGHLNSILELCQNYFFRNPYERWFKKLDYLISGTSVSFYFPSSQACHLDLIPYATDTKWAELTSFQRSSLLNLSGNYLGIILRDSPIRLLVLNGKSVIDNLEKITDIKLEKNLMPTWTLPRENSKGVQGFSFIGAITKLQNIKLKNRIKVIGYNHNVQSSFGITKEVLNSIRNWISSQAKEVL